LIESRYPFMYTVSVGRISKDISFSITSKYEYKI
jgi:hypothetical protein